MKIGFYQFDVAFGDKARNLHRVTDTLSRAEFDLMVLPELFNTGFLFSSRQEVLAHAERVPDGETCRQLIELAKRKDAHIVAGLAEVDDGGVYNTAVLVGPHGLVGKHRKTHLAPVERPFFDRGSGLDVFGLGSVKVGIVICLESWFPEIWRLLTLKGAHVICSPANFAGRWNTGITKVRARENGIYMVNANRTGTEVRNGISALFRGESQIICPDGSILFRAGKQECLVIQDVPLAETPGNGRQDHSREKKTIPNPNCWPAGVTGEFGHKPQHTVLVVEDDLQLRDTICSVLQEAGYSVLQAPDGTTALSVLQHSCPHLILSDVTMPGMDGFTFYQQVRANSCWLQIPFIFVTAKGQRSDVRHGMGLGADDYITKPFQLEELLTAVEVRLAQAETTQAAAYQTLADSRDTILRTLSLELYTPLALMMGYGELLEESVRAMNDEECQALLDGLRTGSERLMRLIEDFGVREDVRSLQSKALLLRAYPRS